MILSPLKSFPILLNCKVCPVKRELVEEMHETEWERTERQDGMGWDGMERVGMVKILEGS